MDSDTLGNDYATLLAEWFRQRGWYLRGCAAACLPGVGNKEGLQLDKEEPMPGWPEYATKLAARVVAFDRGDRWELFHVDGRRYGEIDKAGCPRI